MRYGNCLVGALWLWALHGFRGRILARKVRDRRIGPCHFVLLLPDGTVLHYVTLVRVLPRPLHWVLFEGEFQTFRIRRPRP